jgi:hypothetical protein
MRISNARDGDEAADENSSQRRSYIDYCGHAVSLSEGEGQLIKEGEKGPLRVESVNASMHMADGGDPVSCIGPGTMAVHRCQQRNVTVSLVPVF